MTTTVPRAWELTNARTHQRSANRAARRRAVREIADAIREYDLDGQDVHDLAVSIDADEPDYVGAGREVWALVARLADALAVSAAYLLDEACVCLGWSVAS